MSGGAGAAAIPRPGAKFGNRVAFGLALLDEGRRNERIVALNADLSGSTKTSTFAKEFPHRFFNAGVAECNMMGMAAGLSTTGRPVVASTFAVFATAQVLNVIRQSIAYPRNNVKIVATHAGITVGGDGATHQICEDIALMRVLPHLRVYVPADAQQTYQVILHVLRTDGPAYVRMGRIDTPVIFDHDYRYVPDRVEVLADGDDVTLACCGLLVEEGRKAVTLLADSGISAQLLNVHTIKPLDVAGIESAARRTGRVVSAEEHVVAGGLGSAIAETLAQRYPTPQRFIGLRDHFGESGEPSDLMVAFHLTAADIATSASALVAERDART